MHRVVRRARRLEPVLGKGLEPFVVARRGPGRRQGPEDFEAIRRELPTRLQHLRRLGGSVLVHQQPGKSHARPHRRLRVIEIQLEGGPKLFLGRIRVARGGQRFRPQQGYLANARRQAVDPVPAVAPVEIDRRRQDRETRDRRDRAHAVFHLSIQYLRHGREHTPPPAPVQAEFRRL